MKPVRRVRIGEWLVNYDDATTEVNMTRTVADILAGTPGSDSLCMNAVCIRAQRNEKLFPHPVLMVSTIKTRVYIVDQLHDGGEPAHAIRYQLSGRDGRLIDTHDRYGAGEPGPLRLRVPSDPKGSPKRAASSQRGRFADGDGRYSGDGKATLQRRPITHTTVGAEARYAVAALALKDL